MATGQEGDIHNRAPDAHDIIRLGNLQHDAFGILYGCDICGPREKVLSFCMLLSWLMPST